MERIKFLNTYIDNLTMDEAINEIDRLISIKACTYVVTPNLDHIVQLDNDPELAEAYKHAGLILCDGKPLIWISKHHGTLIKEKISGSDIFPRICELASQRGYKLYILGAAEGVAAKAGRNLIKKFPGLLVVGTYSPKIGFEKNASEMDKIKKQIIEAKPDILAVALGAPKQEKFLYHYIKELNVPIGLGIGASIDFEAGNIKRAPKWMSDHGLEWLYRITQDPKRLIKRYWNDAIRIWPIIMKYGKK